MTPYHFFAPCPRGLELILATELEKLGAFSVQVDNGGVKFRGSWYTCYRTNLESRIASRILWKVETVQRSDPTSTAGQNV